MLQIRLVFMSHLYEMNWEMPWKDMQFRIFLQVYGAFPCVLNHSMSTQARKIGYKAKRQHYKTFVICVISPRRNGTWVKRDGGAGAVLNQAGFLLGWEPLWNCEQEKKKAGQCVPSKNVLDNPNWDKYCLGNVLLLFLCARIPFGRTQWPSQETKPGNDIIRVHWRHSYINLSAASQFSPLVFFVFSKGSSGGKAAWQNPSDTLSLSEDACLAPKLTLQKSGGKSAWLVPLISALRANAGMCWVLWLGACVQTVLRDRKSTISASKKQICNIC